MSVNITAFGDLVPCNVLKEGFDDECWRFVRNVDIYLRQISRHSTLYMLSRRKGRMKCKMLQTAGLGLTHRPRECESELNEQRVQTAKFRGGEYIVKTSLMKIIDRLLVLEYSSILYSTHLVTFRGGGGRFFCSPYP